MNPLLISIILTIAAPAAMAQDVVVEKVLAKSLTNIFEAAYMSYGTDVEGARLFAHENNPDAPVALIAYFGKLEFEE